MSSFKNKLKDRYQVDHAEIEELCSMLDVGPGNELRYSEFLAAVLPDQVRTRDDVLRRTFARFDRGKGGMITVDNLRMVLGDTFDDVGVGELVCEVAGNRQGAISYQDFLRYLQYPAPNSPSLGDEEGPTRRVLTSSAGLGEHHSNQDCSLDRKGVSLGPEFRNVAEDLLPCERLPERTAQTKLGLMHNSLMRAAADAMAHTSSL